ncbi:transglutaminase-like domain-containing protein [Christiangramia portivictoriae]|uniref:transglutaminase-like domain-containing protein n=1 Tax=Christiangramia portivictoriae TaxID=326069 RepID=UPI0009FE7675|nr:transglutaminase-like domain-containing protein [Christiangramia portivictoriae]
MRKRIITFLLLVCMSFMYSQQEYSILKISPELLENADAVVRKMHTKLVVEDIDKVVVYTTRIVTVFNENGEYFIDAFQHHDVGQGIEKQQAIILDAMGYEVDKFRKKDFSNVSAFGSGTLFADNRVSYLDYNARTYPYTVIYTSEFENEDTVFLNQWFPLEGYNVSIEESVYELENPDGHALRFQENNFEDLAIENHSTGNHYLYKLKNIKARKHEDFEPSFRNTTPNLLFSLDKFELKGVAGETRDWKHFGKWMYDHLVAEHDHLPESTIKKMEDLTAGASSIEEKARLIYQYVQENTRYISVQYGIGGWEPETAMNVDRLGYGDCKGLTNYTKALLKSQGIESYYTVIHAGESKRHIEPDFTIMQGNHVILNIPAEDGTDLWLECTSQTTPFNYIGEFTDDRYALRVSEDGGEIVRTKKYMASDNVQAIDCDIQLDVNGNFEAVFTRTSEGVPYGEYYRLQRENEDDLKKYYRNEWGRLQNLNFEDIEFHDDRVAIQFQEELKFSGSRLASPAGERLLVPLNFIQQGNIMKKTSQERTMPFVFERGKTYKDHFSFKIPPGYEIEALPGSDEIASEFGEFSINISASGEDNSIEVDRVLIIQEGEWPSDQFQNFTQFIDKVNTLNNLKAVIAKSKKS